jgi:phospholipid/cholesterol/gamma-HCH transport system substrate-binding protein
VLFLEYMDPLQYPPPPIDYTPHYPYIPSAPSQFSRMIESIEASLQNFQKLDLSSIGLETSNTLAATTLLMQKLDRVDLQGTVGNLDTLITNLNATVGSLNATVNGMALNKLSGNANELVIGLKSTNLKLQTVLDHVGDAPIGDTVNNLQSALKTLNDVLQQLNRYPSGFIFGEPPPPAKSVKPPQ